MSRPDHPRPEVLVDPSVGEVPPLASRSSNRRLLSGRRSWFLTIAALCLVVGLGLWWIVRTGSSWLGTLPAYQIPFDRIEFEPPPPAFLRGGSATILESVRLGSGRPRTLPFLDVDLAALARDFAMHAPWIEEVRAIERVHPNRIRLLVQFRTPVGWVELRPGHGVALDRSGVCLPMEDIDLDRINPLPRIEGLTGIVDHRPGLVLRGPEGSDTAARARAACTLADYARERLASQPGAEWSVRRIHARFGPDKLYLQTTRDLWVLWGSAARETAEQRDDMDLRWHQLTSWLQHAQPDQLQELANQGSYLELGESGPRIRTASRG